MTPARLRALWTGIPRPLVVCFSDSSETPFRRGREITLPLSGGPLAVSLSTLGPALGRSRTRAVDLIWPETHLLERRIDTPAKARRRAAQIADLDLARATPIDRATVLWRNDPVWEDDQFTVRQCVVKKSDIAEAEAALAGQGLTLRSVQLEAAPSAPVILVDNSAKIARPWRWWRRLELAALASAIAAIGYIIAAPHLARQDELERLKTQTATLLAEAEQLSTAVQKREQAHETVAAVRRALTARARSDALLADLTKSLPDGTWLQALQVTDRQAILTGFTTRHAADLVSGLIALPGIANARLSGQVSFDAGTDSERFQMTLDLSEAGS